MKPTPIIPRKSLNKAYLKVKPNRSDIEKFKGNLIELLDRINDVESEEFHKNLVADFMKLTYYAPNHFINTKGRNDQVIHNGKDAHSSVGVILEAKTATNKSEMVTTENLNKKAFQELVLYYLRERITQKNLEIKYLIITNIYEWFVFDATTFERLFAQNKKLVKQFEEFEAGRLADSKTDFFYKQIAEPYIASIDQNVEFTYFDLRAYEKPLRNADRKDDQKLIALYKILSPEHLLKLPFANDSNSLDRKFYSELLHIIGLTEIKDGGKKLIQRNAPGERNTGALIENAVIQLDTLDKIHRLEKPGQYGNTQEERLYHVALELAITWVNRILFLKLLEAQLISYHKGDKSHAFLNSSTIHNYDDLNSLFFQVLAKRNHERSEDVKQDFARVPYLNSSLFEPSDLEHNAIMISNLRDEKKLPILTNTVLKDENGRKRAGEMDALQYLFAFLDAYDFSSEGAEDIQEENKTLINASVLGLIFEKINGYKDGSFFTPGFITMYMCKETIRRAVVQKFNVTKGWKCKDYSELKEDLQEYIKDNDRKMARKEANELINSLKICDPAVGSGHFLVSALNEIIAIKSDLKILVDREGERVSDFDLEVVNDELIITDIDENHLFEYHHDNKRSQRLQEALFHEKQTIIENCLFGVDINPNSVKICRLRLWIELLKNAYYKNENELETLPNIDINIKTGNSLISRFDLTTSLSQTFKNNKKYKSIEVYKTAVMQYKNASDKNIKHELERLIKDIKDNFETSIGNYTDPRKQKLARLGEKLFKLTGIGGDGFSNMLFEPKEEYGSKAAKAKRKKEVEKIEQEIDKLKTELDDIKSSKIYENAFEWRFEFPEVLNDDGDFLGFDLIIGNPPYIRQEELADMKPYLAKHYQSTYAGTADLYVYFVELGLRLLQNEGGFTFIIPNKWMRAGYGQKLRQFVKNYQIHELLDFGDLPVFEEATTYPLIMELSKKATVGEFRAVNFTTLDFELDMSRYILKQKINVLTEELKDEGWTLTDSKVQNLLAKLRAKGQPLGEYVNGKIFRGVLTGLNEAFVIDEETKNRLITEDPNSAEIIKPFLAGRDVKRYKKPEITRFLIFTRRGIEIEKYPAVLNHLQKFKEQLEPKPKDHKGDWAGRKPGSYKWYEIQDAIDYYDEFEKEKIIIPAIVKSASYAYDTSGVLGNDKTSIIPTKNLNLIAQLNSSLVDFYLKKIASTKQNGYFEYKPVYVSQLPIIETNELENIVSQIFLLKGENTSADTSVQEAEIDRLVYELYGLTEEEIAIVEGSVK